MRKSKNLRKNKQLSRKNRKGGFFLNKTSVPPSGECNMNTLPALTKFPDVNDTNGQLKPLDERLNDLTVMSNKLRENYNKCCPKGFMGRKNSTPYCNQLDTTFKSIEQHKQDISGYYGDETDVSKIKEAMDSPVSIPSAPVTIPSAPVSIPSAPVSKPWYQFWGGKKSRKNKRHRKRRTHRRK